MVLITPSAEKIEAISGDSTVKPNMVENTASVEKIEAMNGDSTTKLNTAENDNPIQKVPTVSSDSTKNPNTSSAAAPTCKVVLAARVASRLLEEVAQGLKVHQSKPLLVGFLANDDPAAKAYAEYSAKTCVDK